MSKVAKLFLVIIAVFCTAEGRQFVNPVLDGADYPDPGVILENGTYYAVTTTNNKEWEKYPIHTSQDLQNWTLIGHVFNESNFPSWSRKEYEFWAAEIHKIGNDFVLYFTARDFGTGEMSLGVAKSKNVAGPYTATDKPMRAIAPVLVLDSTLIQHEDTLMLAWVETQYIRICNLTSDGLSFKDDNIVPLFREELPWEGGTVEGPWYLFRNGYHYMFYSGAGFCDNTYALGVARSKNPAGPYEKHSEPLLVSDERFKGPGHGSVVKDTQSDGYVFVHGAWKTGHVCGDNFRLMFSTYMEWGEDDWPKKMTM